MPTISDKKHHCIVLYAEDEKRIKQIQAGLIKEGADKGTMNKSVAIRQAIKELWIRLKEGRNE